MFSVVLVLSLAPVVSAHSQATLCYNYDESRYEECSHEHVSTNYGVSPYYNYNYHNGYNYTQTRYATQTYSKPVTRYVCNYDYYYGNRCYYKTDYVKTYRSVPVSNYNNYYNGYNNYGNYNSYSSYNNYNNYNNSYYRGGTYNTYSYPYSYSSYGYNYPYTYNSGYAYNY